MENFKTLDSNILSLIILIFVYYNAINPTEKVFTNQKIFLALIKVNMLLLVIDIGSWVFDGLVGIPYLVINTVFNLLLFIIEPIVGTLWAFYTHSQIQPNNKLPKKLKYLLLTLLICNGLLSIASLYTGWFFKVDSNNVYSRGSLYLIHILYCYLLLLYSMHYVFKHRKLIEKRYYYSMLVFVLPISIGAALQIIFFGWALAWSGMAVSLLIIYFNIQDRGLSMDYLTGIYNRRQLDNYLKLRVKNSSESKSFSAILIDLNGFKKINDTLGHHVGDEALRDAAQIIKSSLSRDDFVARYGGDEFFIILDSDDKETLEAVVYRLNSNVDKFNEHTEKEYKLAFAIGYAVYYYKTNMQSDNFFKYIDGLMYSNKNPGGNTISKNSL